MTARENRKPNRAGRYEAQPGKYEAFIPIGLPPGNLSIDPELQVLISDADRALGRLDGAAEILPDAELFVFMYVRKEAVLSSQIEGTQASLMDVLEFEANAQRPDFPQDVPEVVNYIAAMNHGIKRLESLPVSVRLIREIHERLLEGVRGGEKRPGELRTTQNFISAGRQDIKDAVFVPPPPAVVPGALAELERFLHDESPMPPLVKIGLAHAQFETIHPFLDGNGRTGRLLITLLLCERGILRRPLLYLSHFLKAHRTEYYDRLQAVRDAGDWEGWLKFFVRGVAHASGEATETARKIIRLREDQRRLIASKLGKSAGRALALHDALFTKPVVSVRQVVGLTRLTFANANKLVESLVRLGLLHEMTGRRRNRAFAFRPYLDLFEEEAK